jgi:hypothetical protein
MAGKASLKPQIQKMKQQGLRGEGVPLPGGKPAYKNKFIYAYLYPITRPKTP